MRDNNTWEIYRWKRETNINRFIDDNLLRFERVEIINQRHILLKLVRNYFGSFYYIFSKFKIKT